MSCDELKDLYDVYALGALDAAERPGLEEHLDRNCPACRAGVSGARQLAAMLALAAPPVEPPARLRARVVASVAPAPARPTGLNWLAHAWATVALAMLAAVLWQAYADRKLEAEISALNRRIGEAKTVNAELAARNRLLGDALALINLPDARQLVFGQPRREPPRGRIWIEHDRGVVLLASQLPPAPAGKAYEMWLIPKAAGSTPIPAGVFNADSQGLAMHVWGQRVDVAAVKTIAVTLEAEGGVPAPTGAILIAAEI